MPSVTLTTTAPIATRVLAALGKTLGLIDGQGQGRSATQQEYSDWLRDVTKRMVQARSCRTRMPRSRLPPTSPSPDLDLVSTAAARQRSGPFSFPPRPETSDDQDHAEGAAGIAALHHHASQRPPAREGGVRRIQARRAINAELEQFGKTREKLFEDAGCTVTGEGDKKEWTHKEKETLKSVIKQVEELLTTEVRGECASARSRPIRQRRAPRSLVPHAGLGAEGRVDLC
jgi:hypothetical protein